MADHPMKVKHPDASHKHEYHKPHVYMGAQYDHGVHGPGDRGPPPPKKKISEGRHKI